MIEHGTLEAKRLPYKKIQAWRIFLEDVLVARVARHRKNWVPMYTDWIFARDLDKRFYSSVVRAALDELVEKINKANLREGDYFEVVF